ncbi:MAG: hotdog fold thioesterase [Betaproteobacteria bacterium]|nr:hotdog fold thioesterase [Betaproteobacteria bacterium]
MIWKRRPTLETLRSMHVGTAVATLGIEFTGVEDDALSARMPVDRRTVQPMGILHGGASALLAETLGSCAAAHCVDPDTHYVVGLEINANHLRPVREGWVAGRATPIHVGRTTQVWDVDIRDEAGRRTCTSRLTLAVIAKQDAK